MATTPIQIVSNNPDGSIFDIHFLRGAAERSLKTGAQTMASVLSVDVIAGTTGQINVLELDWVTLLGIFLGGMLASALTSLANPQFVAGTYKQVIVPGGADVRPVANPSRESIVAAQQALAEQAPPAAGSSVLPTGQVPTP